MIETFTHADVVSSDDIYKDPGVARIASVNVNGIRAAVRKGMLDWLETRDIDILALQEVRASDDVLQEIFDGLGWHISSTSSAQKGRSGVAILSRQPQENVSIGLPNDEYFDETGRWIQSHINVNGTDIKIASAYFPSGEVGTPKQDDKMRYYEAVKSYLKDFNSQEANLIVGDFNVGHTELDIKNWKGNKKNSGFLPEERAYLDYFFEEAGYTDVARTLAGGIEQGMVEEIEGPYTWWSQRGKAFDNNTGWRIDYQMAADPLAQKAIKSVVDRAPSYDTRWSDHAPVVVDYQL